MPPTAGGTGSTPPTGTLSSRHPTASRRSTTPGADLPATAHRVGRSAAGVLLAALVASPAGAADPDNWLFNRKHVFSAGIAEQTLDARIRATPVNFDPVEIEIEDLGVDDRDFSYYLDYRYRFRPRWAVVAGAYSFGGSGGKTNERTFEYDGVEFTAGSQLNASFDVDAYIVDLMYRVHGSDRVEIMLGGGIHALDLGASISGQVRINETSGEFRQAGSTLLAPVPNVRGSLDWLISDRFGVNVTGGWLSAKVDEYDGGFLYGHIKGIYQVTDNLGISLGYQVTDVDITRTRDSRELAFDLTLQGPTFTVAYGF